MGDLLSFCACAQTGSDVGVIAQEVEQAFPQLVQQHGLVEEAGTTFKSVDYPKLTAVLIEAVKEQQDTIDKLHARLEHVEELLHMALQQRNPL